MTGIYTANVSWREIAKLALRSEADAILAAIERLDECLNAAVELLLDLPSNKIIVTGVGKSGHIAAKLAATLCSTGTKAVLLHPVDALHGDLGIYSPGDPTILISKSGTTSELVRLVPILHSFQSPLIGILGNTDSVLASQMNIVIDASVSSEADPYNLVPTSSTTLSLALGDALAMTLMYAKHFTPSDFARFHPSGQLGRNLLLHVKDVMHTSTQIAWVDKDMPLREVIILMTQHPLGAACVVNERYELVGLITDGDVRRALVQHEDIRQLFAGQVMTSNPICVTAEASLKDALELMENRQRQVSVLPVVADTSSSCVGLIRIHDIYANS